MPDPEWMNTFGVRARMFRLSGVTRTTWVPMPDTGPEYAVPASELCAPVETSVTRKFAASGGVGGVVDGGVVVGGVVVGSAGPFVTTEVVLSVAASEFGDPSALGAGVSRSETRSAKLVVRACPAATAAGVNVSARRSDTSVPRSLAANP